MEIFRINRQKLLVINKYIDNKEIIVNEPFSIETKYIDALKFIIKLLKNSIIGKLNLESLSKDELQIIIEDEKLYKKSLSTSYLDFYNKTKKFKNLPIINDYIIEQRKNFEFTFKKILIEIRNKKYRQENYNKIYTNKTYVHDIITRQMRRKMHDR